MILASIMDSLDAIGSIKRQDVLSNWILREFGGPANSQGGSVARAPPAVTDTARYFTYREPKYRVGGDF